MKEGPVLVTGATGFIGRHLTRALVERGDEVIAVGSSECDFRDRPAVHALVSNYRPSLVYHLAARVSAAEDPDFVLQMMRVNLVGAVHLFDALRGTPCRRVVHVGTCEETAAAQSPYGISKAAARLYAEYFTRCGLPVIHARLDLTYGPDQPAHRLVSYLVRMILAGKEPELREPERRFRYLFIDDAVTALIHYGTAPGLEGQTVDIAGEDELSIAEIAELLDKLAHGWQRSQRSKLIDGLSRMLDHYR